LIAEGKTPGGCTNEQECKNYCEMDGNFNECILFLEEHDIISDEELARIKQMGSFQFDGPGGCQDEDECKDYCMAQNNFDECLAFIEENDFIPEEELEIIRQIGSFEGPGGWIVHMVLDPKIGLNIENKQYFITFNITGKKASVKLGNILYVVGVGIVLYSAFLPAFILPYTVIFGMLVVLASYEIFGKKRLKGRY